MKENKKVRASTMPAVIRWWEMAVEVGNTWLGGDGASLLREEEVKVGAKCSRLL
jgi:hypothetical protein